MCRGGTRAWGTKAARPGRKSSGKRVSRRTAPDAALVMRTRSTGGPPPALASAPAPVTQNTVSVRSSARRGDAPAAMHPASPLACTRRSSAGGSRAGATRAQRRAPRLLHGIDPVHRSECNVAERLTARVLRMTLADTRQVSPAALLPVAATGGVHKQLPLIAAPLRAPSRPPLRGLGMMASGSTASTTVSTTGMLPGSSKRPSSCSSVGALCASSAAAAASPPRPVYQQARAAHKAWPVQWFVAEKGGRTQGCRAPPHCFNPCPPVADKHNPPGRRP